MSDELNGELVPEGGGDSIPLLLTPLTVGRRESCDIYLDFSNVSGRHCELSFKDGYWSVKDLNSTNGIKVNGRRVDQIALKPGDKIGIGKRNYEIQYTTSTEVQRKLEEMTVEQEESVFGSSLLEKAGLANPRSGEGKVSRGYNLLEE
ncbi:MAG: FHA domain-containing protein [Gemmataceae bacterium]